MKILSREGGIEFRVRASPRAGRTEVVGPGADALRVRLAAPPVDGAANDELVSALAVALSVPRSAVEITRGRSSRTKTVRVAGIRAVEAAERLAR